MAFKKIREWRGAARTLVLVMAIGTIGIAGPARAAGAGARSDAGTRVAAPVRITATSASNSLASKSIVATCPAGQRVYGAGGEINGGGGNVTMDDITPSLALNNVLVTAIENGAFAGNWTVTAYAICGVNTLNLQRIQFTSVTNSVTPKSVFAGCPSGLRLYGLGAELNGSGGNVFLDDLTPNAGLTGATVTGYENGAFANNWNITGYAICGNPSANMVRRVLTSAAASPVAASATTAACPAGTRVHGVGAELNGALGAVVIDDLRPNVGLLTATATGAENGPFAGNWTVTSYAICSA
ncbi:hypothetical protein I0C86_22265 [Plantactinospora sp. S1510]|uniref:Uncharacterized protein n=1 Tax=Plantactinospora alkalitolerans TaxID=2789879 RepID=A0ABS0H005_9ACTN|nr:hypothetical protein [Plantactinospora alkalitolerans]MBF9131669.1 hypothetical protein [Plantactinospora alkalitolerans]